MRVAMLPLLLLAGVGMAGDSAFGGLELAEKPISLLDGRMEIRMPAAAVVEARQQGIMAAPEAAQRETRIVLDAGEQRMVVMTWEQFASAGEGFEAAARKGALPDTKVEAFAPAEGLKGWRVEPARLDPDDEAAEVARALIADGDGHVMLVAVYVNPPSSQNDETGSRALAAKILASLRPGARKLDLSAREVVLETLPDTRTVRLHLPAGWIHYSQPGPDFVVHHLQQVVALGESPPIAGVYFGGHPSWFHDKKKVTVEREAGTLLGTATEWRKWKLTRITREAMVPLHEERTVHAFLTAAPEQVDEVRKLLESLRIAP